MLTDKKVAELILHLFCYKYLQAHIYDHAINLESLDA
jgi:hypothetical protein